MQSETLLNINLASADEAPLCFDVILTDHFFANLEQEEINGGNVHAHLHIHATADNIYLVDVEAEGQVIVACDRCLDPLTLPVKIKEQIKLKHAAPEASDAPDMIYANASAMTYNLSWQLYELIETSLPLQRVHKKGNCNLEVARYILQSADETDENTTLAD